MRWAYSSGEATAEIDSLPGCTQIAVVHAAFVDPLSRGKGVGSKAHMERLDFLRYELLYDLALATVDLSNEHQLKIMEKAGWTQVYSFVSRKTRHHIGLFSLRLGDS